MTSSDFLCSDSRVGKIFANTSAGETRQVVVISVCTILYMYGSVKLAAEIAIALSPW